MYCTVHTFLTVLTYPLREKKEKYEPIFHPFFKGGTAWYLQQNCLQEQTHSKLVVISSYLQPLDGLI